MANVTGLNNLKVLMRSVPIDTFKQKVRIFVESMNSYKDFFIKMQQARLVNPYIKDGRTAYPHIRTGNLMRNLIEIKMDRFKESNFKQSAKSLSYSFETINRLDGGYGNARVFRKGKDGSKFNYARYLNEGGKRTSRYKGYFGRLQGTFKSGFESKFKELNTILKG